MFSNYWLDFDLKKGRLMKSAYLYVRVSTDEQKRKGYSLPEQEDRLLKYCEYNDIVVKGIFREDFSAKISTAGMEKAIGHYPKGIIRRR
jgi:nanoRNase/pAp phosphatase (c-di-AMP/oligoRNAs hydrolase)